MRTPWVILTGEYPPQPGGVSDYTRQIARGLASAGDEVHVWASHCPNHSTHLARNGDGVHVHRLPDHFGPAGIAALDSALARMRSPYRLLVQYVPHAFGYKAMNLPFCLWLGSRRRDQVWAMFHEVQFPFSYAQPLRHNVLAGVTHLMARALAQAADEIFISIPAWADLLRPMISPDMRRKPMTWLPVPTNLPTSADAAAAKKLREHWTAGNPVEVIGHFGTFGPLMRPLLREVLPPLLDSTRHSGGQRICLLLGRGGEALARDLGEEFPHLRRNLIAPGELPGLELANHLAAVDLLVQPYPDGVSARRGTLMAALALGVPAVANSGPRTESIWSASQAVALTPDGDAPAMIADAEKLLSDAASRRELSQRAKSLYFERFSVDHTIAALRNAADLHDSRNVSSPAAVGKAGT